MRIDIITSSFLHPVAIFQYIHLGMIDYIRHYTNSNIDYHCDMGPLPPIPSDAQSGTDMFGRNMYDNMGMYIPPYAQPGGAIPANFGNPAYGHWETTTKIESLGFDELHADGTHSEYSWSKTIVDSRFIWNQTPGGGGAGGDWGNIGFTINGALDKTATLLDANVYGAQKLAGVAAKNMVKLTALKTLGTITGVISFYENGSKFLDNPSANWWNGVEAVGQVGFMVLGGEEAQIIYNVSTLAIDATIEVIKRKQSEQ